MENTDNNKIRKIIREVLEEDERSSNVAWFSNEEESELKSMGFKTVLSSYMPSEGELKKTTEALNIIVKKRNVTKPVEKEVYVIDINYNPFIIFLQNKGKKPNPFPYPEREMFDEYDEFLSRVKHYSDIKIDHLLYPEPM